MKAQLKFDLDDPDDRMAHLRCTKSLSMAIALFDIVYNVRKELEMDADQCEKEEDAQKYYTIIEQLYSAINRVLDDNSINIDELIE